MKRSLLLVPVLLLAACVDTTGLTKESNRGPHPAGSANAAVVVVEFADLQCPACQTAHQRITRPLLEKYGKQITFHLQHFPLRSLHRYALDAALAAECAADQGKFWEYVDLAYERQKEMNKEAFAAWAEQLKLDMDLFGRCVKSEIKRDTILADYDEGEEAGVRGTPTYFVNGEQTDVDKLDAAVTAALKGMMQKL